MSYGAVLVASTVIGTLAAIGISAMKKNRTIMLGATNIPLLNADIVTGISMMLLFVKFMNLSFVTVLIAHITFDVPLCDFERAAEIKPDKPLHLRGCLRSRCHSDVRVLQGDLAGDQIRYIFRIPDGGYHVARRFFHHLFTKGAGVNTLSTMLSTELRKGVRPELYALSTIFVLFAFLLLLVMNRRSDRIAGNHAGIH